MNMNVSISKHAKEQAIIRGITEDGIMAIVSGNQFVAIIPSNIDPDVDIFSGMYEGKIWSVLFNVKTKNVVTVRRAWKKEEKYYEEKKRG